MRPQASTKTRTNIANGMIALRTESRPLAPASCRSVLLLDSAAAGAPNDLISGEKNSRPVADVAHHRGKGYAAALQVFRDRPENKPRIDEIAPEQALRLLDKTPEPLKPRGLHPGRRPAQRACMEIQSGPDSQAVSVTKQGPMTIDPDFGFGRSDTEEDMRRMQRSDPVYQSEASHGIGFETEFRHMYADLRLVEARREQTVTKDIGRHLI